MVIFFKTRTSGGIALTDCDMCGRTFFTRTSHYHRKHRHFCSKACYSIFRELFLPPNEQPRWTGGVSHTEAHRRWKAKNPERMAHLKARRYARERGAQGSHTLAEWESLRLAHGGKCANCHEPKPLTKDHIVPLSKGGTDYITNIQPLCRNCNSRKWAKHKNPELLKP